MNTVDLGIFSCQHCKAWTWAGDCAALRNEGTCGKLMLSRLMGALTDELHAQGVTIVIEEPARARVLDGACAGGDCGV